MIKRRPVAAGKFYKSKDNYLIEQIEEAFVSNHGPQSIPVINKNDSGATKALICPHAGYMYSGPVAACAYHNLATDHCPKHFLLIGPNHSGYGSQIALFPEGYWQTPLGEITVDNSWMGSELKSNVEEDELAHRFEHSLEVQLPFLQYLFKNDFKISAICIKNQSFKEMKIFSEYLLKTDFPLIIASSDLSHYEPADTAKAKDSLLIKALEEKNTEKMYELAIKNNISACGIGAIAIVSLLAKEKNWEIKTLRYKTSGDITGDINSVVGYMSAAAIKKED